MKDSYLITDLQKELRFLDTLINSKMERLEELERDITQYSAERVKVREEIKKAGGLLIEEL
jgi:peptidoglycan hydrolase CwlO-like protein